MTFILSTNTTVVTKLAICVATLSASEPFDAIECRATPKGSPYGRGIGLNVLTDTLPTEQGAYILPQPAYEFTFDIKSIELSETGEYDITIYVRDMRGNWNDTLLLATEGYDIASADGYLITLQKGLT